MLNSNFKFDRGRDGRSVNNCNVREIENGSTLRRSDISRFMKCDRIEDSFVDIQHNNPDTADGKNKL